MRYYSKNLTPLSRIYRDSKPKKALVISEQAKLIGLILVWSLMILAIIQVVVDK